MDFLEAFGRDFRYGIRSLRRSPAFTLTALATLALTMAAVATIFSLANALLFRSPPFERPNEIVTVAATRHRGRVFGEVSYPDYARFRDHNRTLGGLAAYYSGAPLWVTANGAGKEASGAVVSANFFPLLGVHPELGRFFRPEEDRVPDRDRVAVLGHSFWRDSFGGSDQVLGAAVTINGTGFTVIGVAPDSFRGVLGAAQNEIYIPTMMLHTGYRWCDALAEHCDILSMVGRLRGRATVEQAQADMTRLLPSEWAREEGQDNSGIRVLRPRGTENPGERALHERSMALLTLVAVLLLLVCCANLAGLLTARSTARVRDLAIRSALGARRGRIVRQLMTEAALLAAAGGGAGTLLSLGLTRWLNSAFYAMDEEGYRHSLDLGPDATVVAGVAVVSLGATLLFGLLPASRAVGWAAPSSLAQHAATFSPRSRWVSGLVTAQAATAVGLVAVASLLVAGARRLVDRPGFDPAHVALLRARPRLLDYAPERARRFQREVLKRLEALPGVSSASLVGTGCVYCGSEEDVSSPVFAGADQTVAARAMDVGPGYFRTLHIPLLAGRDFGEQDAPASLPVAIVNEALAQRLWLPGAAVGSTLVVGGRQHRVVGVVATIASRNSSAAGSRYAYVPYWQNPDAVDARYCVRVSGDPAVMLPTLARAASEVDPGVPITELLTLHDRLAASVAPARMSASACSYAALLAILLSGIGVYGTLSLSVSQRTREIGIRMALGAEGRSVLSMILREGAGFIGLGAALGTALAAVGSGLVRHLLYIPPGQDAYFWAGGTVLVLLMGLFASFLPARRAARTELLIALKAD
jgi:putative ABC transport system permease protein